jgi:hypothetical protein
LFYDHGDLGEAWKLSWQIHNLTSFNSPDRFGTDLDDEAVASTSMRGGMRQYFFAKQNGAEKIEFAYRNAGGFVPLLDDDLRFLQAVEDFSV